MIKVIRENPVIFQGLILGLVGATLLLLQSFGVNISNAQQIGIGGFVAALFALWLFLIRAQVTPAALVVARKTDDGVIAGAASPLPDGTPVEVRQDMYKPLHGMDDAGNPI